ncbi:Heat shock 22 kDa protein, mitochondrial [Linum grandiflorum]
MASSLALKKLLSSSLLPTSLRLPRSVVGGVAPSASRLFNTNAVRDYDGEDRDERQLDADRRSRSPYSRSRDDFFSDVFVPFSPSRSLSQVLNLMDQYMENPIFSGAAGGSPGLRRGWDAKETVEDLQLRVDMPGLGKDDVKVAVEQNTLVIRGEGAKESEEEESSRRYSSRIDLPEKIYRIDQVKAEMKNGVLKVTVPKVKEEERQDVVHVNVE